MSVERAKDGRWLVRWRENGSNRLQIWRARQWNRACQLAGLPRSPRPYEHADRIDAEQEIAAARALPRPRCTRSVHKRPA